MVNLLKKINKAWNETVLYIRCKRAIKSANKKAVVTGKKYLVVIYDKKPIVLSKQHVKKLIHEGVFVKGMTPEKIEKLAIYKTR